MKLKLENGNKYFKERNIEEALAYYNAYIVEEKENSEVYEKRGKCYLK
jgi:hypothetical protein